MSEYPHPPRQIKLRIKLRIKIRARGFWRAFGLATQIRESGVELDAEQWRTEVGEPVLRLGRAVLPVLSQWGASVGLGTMLTIGTISCLLMTFHASPVAQAVWLLFATNLAEMPFVFAIHRCRRSLQQVRAA